METITNLLSPYAAKIITAIAALVGVGAVYLYGRSDGKATGQKIVNDANVKTSETILKDVNAIFRKRARRKEEYEKLKSDLNGPAE